MTLQIYDQVKKRPEYRLTVASLLVLQRLLRTGRHHLSQTVTQ